jgi:ABC-type transport system involved in cytochrome c biogenesis permease subunit
MVIAPGRREAIRTIDSLHYWYVLVGAFLLLAGIMTGSMWAASSWGRYWGWDPKEVWSLVAFLGYLAILHVRIDRERIPNWAYVVAGALAVGLFALIIPLMGPVTGWKLLAFVATAAVMALFVLTRGEFTTAVKSILAFWLIIMTYVGVNYVLGTGLHSYGFGRGGVASRMFLYGGVDIAIVVLCGIVYFLRSGSPRGGSRALRFGTHPAAVDPAAR